MLNSVPEREGLNFSGSHDTVISNQNEGCEKMKDLLLLLILQLAYVPMLALRTICMVRKLSILTAVFGFLESVIYVFGLAIVFTGDQSILQMVVYAIGFSLGLIVGIQIENKIAIGYTSFLVNIKDRNDAFVEALREAGFGVTMFSGEGRDGARYRLDILTRRSREPEVFSLISAYEPDAFVLSYEPTRFRGGFMEQMMKKESGNFFARGGQGKKTSWMKKEKEKTVLEVKELVKSEDKHPE